MDNKIKFPSHVILVDVEYLNFVIDNLKGFLSSQLNRELQNISVADVFTYMALDAKIEEGAKDIQVFMIHNNHNEKLHHATPSNISEDLNGVAFNSTLGEFIFSDVPTKEFTTIEELYQELIKLSIASEDVKKILLIGEDIADKELISSAKNSSKKLFQFRIERPIANLDYDWDMIIFPLMKAFGVDSSEIQ